MSADFHNIVGLNQYSEQMKLVTIRSSCLATNRVQLLNPMDCSLRGSSVHGDTKDKSTGGAYNALLQSTIATNNNQ